MVGGFDGWCLPLEIHSHINSFPQASLMLFVVDARCARAAFRKLDNAVECGVRCVVDSYVNVHHSSYDDARLDVPEGTQALETRHSPSCLPGLHMNVVFSRFERV